MKKTFSIEEAFANAVASVEMEGYCIPQEERELCLQVLHGKLSEAEYIEIMLNRIGGISV